MDFDYEALMNWFADFDNAVRCRSYEEINEFLISIGKFGASDLSGAYDRVHEFGIVYFARVRWSKSEIKIGYGIQDNIDRHPEYKPIEFEDFKRTFNNPNRPTLLEILSA